jgi:hypothetical protein
VILPRTNRSLGSTGTVHPGRAFFDGNGGGLGTEKGEEGIRGFVVDADGRGNDTVGSPELEANSVGRDVVSSGLSALRYSKNVVSVWIVHDEDI